MWRAYCVIPWGKKLRNAISGKLARINKNKWKVMSNTAHLLIEASLF